MESIKGISYPFRFSPKGGIATSITNVYDTTHIAESIEQILRTSLKERVMELDFGSELYKHVHSSSWDEVDLTTIKYLIREAIEKNDDRVEILDVIIDSRENADNEENIQALDIQIIYLVKKYQTKGVMKFSM